MKGVYGGQGRQGGYSGQVGGHGGGRKKRRRRRGYSSGPAQVEKEANFNIKLENLIDNFKNDKHSDQPPLVIGGTDTYLSELVVSGYTTKAPGIAATLDDQKLK